MAAALVLFFAGNYSLYSYWYEYITVIPVRVPCCGLYFITYVTNFTVPFIYIYVIHEHPKPSHTHIHTHPGEIKGENM